jgi:hypothetical protein
VKRRNPQSFGVLNTGAVGTTSDFDQEMALEERKSVGVRDETIVLLKSAPSGEELSDRSGMLARGCHCVLVFPIDE